MRITGRRELAESDTARALPRRKPGARIRFLSFAFAASVLALPALGGAQSSSPASAPAAGAFLGRIRADLDSTPIRAADIKVTSVDSVHVGSSGTDGLEIFSDSAHAWFATSDATGLFVVRGLAKGRYVVAMRRIGYEPLQAVLSVDTGEVRATFVMHQVSRTLAKVVVTESAVDDVKLRLDRDGFTWRSKAEPMGHFIKRADILHERTALTLGDLLAHYQIYEDDPNSFLLDDRLTDYDEIRSYPLSAVIGIELYPRQRPIEYSGLRDPRLSMMSQGSLRKHTLVVIWTYPLASVKGSSQRR